jgi:hypothetical protein
MDTKKLTELLQQNPGQLLDRPLFEISGTSISAATLVGGRLGRVHLGGRSVA